jgi:hypothetical protein
MEGWGTGRREAIVNEQFSPLVKIMNDRVQDAEAARSSHILMQNVYTQAVFVVVSQHFKDE